MITGDKLVIKPISSEHTSMIVKWRNNLNVRSNFIFQEPFTEEMHNAWLKNKVEQGDVVQFIVYTKENDIPIGSVYLRDIDRVHQKAEFGIFIGEDIARGKGYGTEATKLLCQYGFKKLGLHKIMLRVFSFNQAAIKAYENAGFKQEAYLKDEIKIGNEFFDIIFMACFNE